MAGRNCTRDFPSRCVGEVSENILLEALNSRVTASGSWRFGRCLYTEALASISQVHDPILVTAGRRFMFFKVARSVAFRMTWVQNFWWFARANVA